MLAFSVLQQTVAMESDDRAVIALLRDYVRGMPPADLGHPELRYRVKAGTEPASFIVSRDGAPSRSGKGFADLIYMLEKDLTVELQRRRADLLFLHSAVLQWKGRAYLIVAESGAGKSTTAWGLLHYGFEYLSDELAPVDLVHMTVLPYPRALCLKSIPAQFMAPPGALDLGETVHIPPQSLPGTTIHLPTPIAAIYILQQRSDSDARLEALGRGEAAARLYTNSLNPLAHPNRGLDAVMRIVEQVQCFTLTRTELRETCALVLASIEEGR